jgi:hypothetical protein
MKTYSFVVSSFLGNEENNNLVINDKVFKLWKNNEKFVKVFLIRL